MKFVLTKQKSRRNLFLVLIASLVVVTSCKKFIYESVAGLLVDEAGLWEDRPAGIECTPSSNSETLNSNGELTFSKDHMLCIDITMNSDHFEIMRNESRFGPSIQENDGASVTAILLEFLNQCDVPFPKEFNWYAGSVVIDGISASNVGLRKKGFLGSIFSIAPSMKINTARNVGGQTIGNTQNVTLNNNSEDPTRIKNLINLKVFEMAGYDAAPRANLANVSVNGEALGVYTHLEAVDDAFLLRVFGNNSGHLYEGQLADFVADWLPRWDAKTDNTSDLATPLLGIASALELPDDQLIAGLEQHIDIDKFITYWALEALLGHVDGYALNRNNFFVYVDPSDGNRITFIPWGMNYFGGDEAPDNSLNDFVKSEIPRRLSRIPEMNAKFEAELQRLIDEVWDATALMQLVDEYAIQVQSGQVDNDYDMRISQLKTWINQRAAVMESALTSGLPQGDAQRAGCFGD